MIIMTHLLTQIDSAIVQRIRIITQQYEQYRGADKIARYRHDIESIVLTQPGPHTDEHQRAIIERINTRTRNILQRIFDTLSDSDILALETEIVTHLADPHIISNDTIHERVQLETQTQPVQISAQPPPESLHQYEFNAFIRYSTLRIDPNDEFFIEPDYLNTDIINFPIFSLPLRGSLNINGYNTVNYIPAHSADSETQRRLIQHALIDQPLGAFGERVRQFQRDYGRLHNHHPPVRSTHIAPIAVIPDSAGLQRPIRYCDVYLCPNSQLQQLVEFIASHVQRQIQRNLRQRERILVLFSFSILIPIIAQLQVQSSALLLFLFAAWIAIAVFGVPRNSQLKIPRPDLALFNPKSDNS